MKFLRVGRPLRIGTRWTMFYTAVMLATIVLLGSALYLSIKQKLYSEASLILQYYVSEAAEELQRTPANSSDVVRSVVERLVALDSALRPGIAVFDIEGQEIGAAGTLARSSIEVPPLLRRGDAEQTTFNLDLGGPYPFLASVVKSEHGFIAVVIDTSRFSRSAADTRKIFAVVLPVAVLITIAGGAWLARATLRPISEIAATARRITGEQLDLTVPTTGSNDELDELAVTLNTMIAGIRDSVEKLRNVSLGAAHQLKSPLASLRSQIEVALETEKMDAASRKRLESILRDLVEMSEGVAAMLRLVRSEAGLSPNQAKPVDLSDLLDSIATLFEPMASERGISLRLVNSPRTIVNGDPSWLSQLFGNLLDNAIRYNKPGGCVEISVDCRGRQVVIRIADTGIGIAPEDVHRVFDRFQRASVGRDTPGWGLGLAIAYEIARSHEGGIAVESQPGAGSVFTVRLPRLDIDHVA